MNLAREHRRQDQVDRELERRERLERYAEKNAPDLGPAAPLHPIFTDLFQSLGFPQRTTSAKDSQ